jgi:protein gp37
MKVAHFKFDPFDSFSWFLVKECHELPSFQTSRLRVLVEEDLFTVGGTTPEDWEFVSELRERLGKLIDETPYFSWMLLTKSPQYFLEFGPIGFTWTREGVPKNVWVGTSFNSQKELNERIPQLLKIDATKRFIFAEPRESLKLPIHYGHGTAGYDDFSETSFFGVDWVICSGEIGENSKPMHPDWVRELRNQCEIAGVPFFFRGWGDWLPVDAPRMDYTGERLILKHNGELSAADFADCLATTGDAWAFEKHGLYRSGRKLDGREWNEVLEP